jgi:pantetheine-phosphate adenylyltransferase
MNEKEKFLYDVFNDNFVSGIHHKYTFDNSAIDIIESLWSDPWRHYHSFNFHLYDLVHDIYISDISMEHKHKLYLVAYYHDIFYNPLAKNNEELSANYLRQNVKCDCEGLIEEVACIIEDTTIDQTPRTTLSKIFKDFDWKILKSDFNTLLKYEKAIFKEYQYIDWTDYKKHRLAFLSKSEEKNVKYLMEYIEQLEPRIGIFPGSFNPFTNGHMDILKRAEKIFDKVIIGLGQNANKQQLSEDTRKTELMQVLPNYQIEYYSGLLSEYVTSKDYPVTVIRGIRNGKDLDEEQTLVKILNECSESDIEFIHLITKTKYQHVSSSMVRELSNYGKGEKYLPKKVLL